MLKHLSSLGEKIANLFGEYSFATPYSKGETEEVEQIFSWKSISKLLSYRSYDEESALFLGEDTAGFVIEAAPFVGMDGDLEKEFQGIFETILEEGDAIQVLLFADHRTKNILDKWIYSKDTAEPLFQWIAKKRSDFFLDEKKSCSRNFRLIFSYSRECAEELNKDFLDKILKKQKKIERVLSNKTPVQIWNAEDLINTATILLDLSLEKEIKNRKYNKFQLISEQISNGGALKVKKEGLEFERAERRDVHFKGLYVDKFPPFWSIHAMQNLIGDPIRDAYRINGPFCIQYAAYYPLQGKEHNVFVSKAKLSEIQGRSSALMKAIPKLKYELEEIQAVREELNRGAKFVWAQMSVGIWGDKEEIEDLEQQVRSIFLINDFQLVENRYTHLPALLGLLPMSWSKLGPDMKNLGIAKTTISTESVNLLPVQGEWSGTPQPGMMLIGRRGQLLNWNLFDNNEGNYNAIVVGKSGSGKSVFMQEMIFSGLSNKGRVFVLDVGRSYEKLCGLLGGQQVEFSGESLICMNPFTKIPLKNQEEQENIFANLRSLVGTMASPTEGSTDFENSLIDQAIRSSWKSKKNKATITDVANWLLSHEKEEGYKIGSSLFPYTKEGIYAKFFEGDNNIDLKGAFSLIELEELKGRKDLQSVVLQVYMMEVANQMFLGDRKTKSYIIIDEAWDLLKSKQTGPFIEAMARRLRKYMGALVIGTQGLDDFFKSDGALAAYENSDWQVLLSQKADSVNRFIKHQGAEISDGQRKMISSLTMKRGEYSDVMITRGSSSFAVGRLMLDPFSQMLFSTHAEEYSEAKRLQKEEGLSLIEAIDTLVKRKQEKKN